LDSALRLNFPVISDSSSLTTTMVVHMSFGLLCGYWLWVMYTAFTHPTRWFWVQLRNLNYTHEVAVAPAPEAAEATVATANVEVQIPHSGKQVQQIHSTETCPHPSFWSDADRDTSDLISLF
jgi:hypothetical protein